MYKAVFSRKAEKSFKRIPREYQLRLKDDILELENNPLCCGTIKLINYPIAKYRHRTDDYRILFDIWEEKKVLMILDIQRRTSTTY